MRACTRPRRLARSSSPRPALRSSRIRTTASSAGSSQAASCSSSTTPHRRSRRTVTCWTIRRRPRSSVVARASACSTSTPTVTVPAVCSSSSAWAPRRMSAELVTESAVRSEPLSTLKRVAVIPAYNEENNVGRVIDELRALDPGLDLVVISDGSTDRTAEIAIARGAHVVVLPFNLGIGGAVQTGFRYAWEEGYELAVRLDGDGQHDPTAL